MHPTVTLEDKRVEMGSPLERSSAAIRLQNQPVEVEPQSIGISRRVITERLTVVVEPQLAMPADIETPRTLQDLADAQRAFLASVPHDMVDVELPPDD